MKAKYEVARQHLGDRLYQEGETRELDANDAQPLVDLGVLVGKKSETKARKGAPENK